MVIVPCTFLPYTFTFTKQLMITMLVSLLWAICFLLFKVNEIKKNHCKGKATFKETINLTLSNLKKLKKRTFILTIPLIIIVVDTLIL